MMPPSISMMLSPLSLLRQSIRFTRLPTTLIVYTRVCSRGLSCSKWNNKQVPHTGGMRYSLPILTPYRLNRQTARPAGDFAGAPPTHDDECLLTDAEYEDVSDETLDSLTEVFEQLAEGDLGSSDFDVAFSSGVLTVNLGQYGTYVINKQTPNKQIWLSSPVSGPKRYDYRNGAWIYKHDGLTLHRLITTELSHAFGQLVDFSQCAYATQDQPT